MMEDYKVVVLGDAILKGFKRLILEFNDPSAIETDQVIMMGPFRGGFIPSLSIRKFPLGGQTETGEKSQGPINRRVTDFGVRCGHLGINL